MYFRQSAIFAATLLLSQSLPAALPRAPYCVDYRANEDGIFVIWYYEGVNQRCYLNDFGEIDAYFLVHEQDLNNRALVKLGGIDPTYPMESISLFIWGLDLFPNLPGGPQSPFGLSIFSAFPTSTDVLPLWQEDSLVAGIVPPSGQWHDFPVRQRLPVEDTAYVQFRWLPETPAAPLLGVDYLPGVHYSSLYGYQQDSQTVWGIYYGGAFLIRLHQGLPDTLPDLPPAANLPDSFSLFLGTDSSDCVSRPKPYLVVKDSLHVWLPSAEASARFLTIAAWHGDRPGPKSAPLHLAVEDSLPFPLLVEPESLLVHTEEGGTLETGISFANPMAVLLSYEIDIPEEDRNWLAVKREKDSLAAGEQRIIELTIDSRELAAGDNGTALWITCTAADLLFAGRSYRIHNLVNISTTTRTPTSSLDPASTMTQNRPNPFSETTTIWSHCSEPVRIYNLLGKLVVSLEATGGRGRGCFFFTWGGCDNHGQPVAAGVYFYVQEGQPGAGKMLLLK